MLALDEIPRRNILCGVPFNIGMTSNEPRIHKTENKEEPKVTSMESFLDSLNKKGTKSTYKRGVELFVTWYGKDVDTILAEPKA